MKKFIAAAALAAFAGCTDDSRENLPEENFSFSDKRKSSEELKQNSAVDTLKNPSVSQPERLFMTLPETIRGAKTLPPTYGRISAKQGDASTAQREYELEGGGMMIIAVTDYAANPSIVKEWQSNFRNISSSQAGVIVKNISGPGYTGYESWTSEQRSSTLKAIRDNRFLIEVRATRLPQGTRTLEELMQMVNLQSLGS